jgi:hypothetical protein
MKMVTLPRATQQASLLIVIVLLLMTPVSAKITGSIGNARMVLHIPTGESLDKCILVKNVNDVDVQIQLIPAGELADSIVLQEETFVVAAGTDKDACFTITAPQEGTTETKINVMFSPVGGGNGVGLSSTIVVISEKKKGFFENIFGNSEEETKTGRGISGILIISLIVMFVLLGLLATLIFSFRKKSHHEINSTIESKPGVKTKK